MEEAEEAEEAMEVMLMDWLLSRFLGDLGWSACKNQSTTAPEPKKRLPAQTSNPLQLTGTGPLIEGKIPLVSWHKVFGVSIK